MDDATLLLTWRNDPRVFANFRVMEPVEPNEHIRWLAKSLASLACHILIAEKEDMPIGMIRLDERDGDEQEISIIVEPDHQGQGVGFQMLDFVCRCENSALIAEIKRENTASRRIFEKCGFRQMTPTHKTYIWYRRDGK